MSSIALKTFATAVVMTTVTLSALAQPPERGQRGRGGEDAPPKKGRFGGDAAKKGGPGGMSPFKVGAVIMPFMRPQLDLSEAQVKEIDKLEAEVAERLKKILNEEQYEMLSRPPFPGGPGGPGGFGGGRGGFGPPRGEGPPEGDEAPPKKGGRGKGAPKKKGPPRDDDN